MEAARLPLRETYTQMKIHNYIVDIVTVSLILFTIMCLVVLSQTVNAESRFNDVWVRGWLNVTNETIFSNITVGNVTVNDNLVVLGKLGVNTTHLAQTLTVQGILNVTSRSIATTPSIYVTSAGNVGMGTATPGFYLDVQGGAFRASNAAYLATNGGNVCINASTNCAQTLTVQGTLNVTANTSSGGNFIIAPNGMVGIGVTKPSFALQVNTSDTNAIVITRTAGSHMWGLGNKLDITNGRFNIGTNEYGDMLTLMPTGEIGINATHPAHTLTVQGTLNVTAAGQGSTPALFVTSSGNVGIGTAAPTELVNIVSGGTPRLALNDSDTGASAKMVADGNSATFGGGPNTNLTLQAGNNNIIRITTEGNVGIGTTKPGSLLHLSSATPEIRLNDTDDPNWWQVGAVGDDFKIALNDSTTDVLYINQDGNVGIGTTNPSYKLSVAGNTNISNSGNANLTVQSTGGSNAALVLERGSGGDGSVDFRFIASGGNLKVVSDENANENTPLWIGGTNGGRMLGHIGINTSSPANTLTVQGTLNVTTQPTRSGDLFVASSGNVGIGTTGPSSILQIKKDQVAATNLIIENDGASGTSTGILFNNVNGDRGFFSQAIDTADISIGAVYPTALVTIKGNGKVGIGTTAPATTLDVKGKANFTGNFSVGQTSNIFFVDNTSGNVGIGTASPNYKLEVEGTDPRLGIESTSTTGYVQISFIGDGRTWV